MEDKDVSAKLKRSEMEEMASSLLQEAKDTMQAILQLASEFTHWGGDKMDDILRTTFSNSFYCMIMYVDVNLKFVPFGSINDMPALVQMTILSTEMLKTIL